MATVTPTTLPDSSGVFIVTWGQMTTSDVGGPTEIGRWQSLTIQNNSSGGGTVQLQGSNDGTNFISIGAALAAGTLTKLSVNPRFLQISTVAAATVQSVVLVCSGRGS